MAFEKNYPTLTDGEALEYDIRPAPDVRIPPGATACTARELGLKPGDFEDRRYQFAYCHVMIVAEERDAFVSVAKGKLSQKLLDKFVEMLAGKGVERLKTLETNDGRYVLKAAPNAVERMRNLGFNVRDYVPEEEYVPNGTD